MDEPTTDGHGAAADSKLGRGAAGALFDRGPMTRDSKIYGAQQSASALPG